MGPDERNTELQTAMTTSHAITQLFRSRFSVFVIFFAISLIFPAAFGTNNARAATNSVATPTFSPIGGSYVGAQTVTINTTTPGATIYYTTNGSTPTTFSRQYTAPFTVSRTTTVKAVATAAGYSASTIGTVAYTIAPSAVSPTFNLSTGTYTSVQAVTMSSTTGGAIIRYTTDGSTPTLASTQYISPIVISRTTTLKAIATAVGYGNSAVVSRTYTINLPAAMPTFSQRTGNYVGAQTVTISSTTSGALIYYTTDNSTPTSDSARYTGPLTLSQTVKLKAIAIARGYSTSAVGSVLYNITQVTASPTLSPSSGNYTQSQTVVISSTTVGATVYYTTDGSTPTSSSTQYTGPITVSQTTTVKAIATATGYSNSGIGTAVYTFIQPATAAPTLSLNNGTYNAVQTVIIRSTTPGAIIYYTTDGSTPTTSSSRYTGPVTVDQSVTLRVIATARGYTASGEVSGSYAIILPASKPTFIPRGGSYTNSRVVAISSPTPGATIYYTTDGSIPSIYSNQYTGPFAVNQSVTLRAITVAAGYSDSDVALESYVINLPTATLSLSPGAGSYTTVQTVVITSSIPGAMIYYTMDGSTPTTYSSLYTEPLTIDQTTTVKAIAVARGYSTSAVVTGTYIVTQSSAAPIISPSGGTYTSAQTVTISTTTPGTTIYYTTNGSTPSIYSNRYTGPFTVERTSMVRAIAAGGGYSSSGVVTETYTINLPAATPTLSPSGGTYTSSQTVTIRTVTPGTTIYYTIDGSIPSIYSSRYTGPFTVGRTMTVLAIATGGGYSSSEVGTAAYTINLPATAPTISPSGGTYTSIQTVTINSSTPEATIYYTTDGSTPSVYSNWYTGPFVVDRTTTVKAIVTKDGSSNSAVSTATYTINLPAETPTFNPSGGTYTSAQTVTISTTTPGTTIYYTTNGSTPSIYSNRYTGPFTVERTSTVRAIVAGGGYSTSGVTTELYTIQLPTATPILTPSGGTYSSAQTVRISSATNWAMIYYTTDGSTPTIYSTRYPGAFTISEDTVVKAIAVATGYSVSDVATGTYTISIPPESVTFNQAARQRDGRVVVTGSAQPGVAIQITWPDDSSGLVMSDAATGEWSITSGIAYEKGETVSASAYTNAGESDPRSIIIDVYSTVGNYRRDECVQDNETGLMWEGKTTTGLRASTNSYTNYDNYYYDPNGQMYAATNSYGYAAYVNSIGLCGFTDWRIPSKDELNTLVDIERLDPAINTDWFPNTVGWYWTSSPYVGYLEVAYGVYFFHRGYIGGDSAGNRSGIYAVRLVRTGQ